MLRASATIEDFPTTIDIGISPSECIIEPRLTAKSAWTIVPHGIATATCGNVSGAQWGGVLTSTGASTITVELQTECGHALYIGARWIASKQASSVRGS